MFRALQVRAEQLPARLSPMRSHLPRYRLANHPSSWRPSTPTSRRLHLSPLHIHCPATLPRPYPDHYDGVVTTSASQNKSRPQPQNPTGRSPIPACIVPCPKASGTSLFNRAKSRESLDLNPGCRRLLCGPVEGVGSSCWGCVSANEDGGIEWEALIFSDRLV